MRCLGKVHGYYDDSDWKNAVFIDMLVETYSDLFGATAKAAFFTPEEEKEAALTALKDGLCTKYFRICERRLEQNETKFIAGDKITIADFCNASYIFNSVKNEESPCQSYLAPLLEEFPKLAAYSERLGEELKNHLNSRPKHGF